MGVEILQCDFYVDYLISSASSKKEEINIIHQTSAHLSRATFKLRKWCSNVPDVLEEVPEDDKKYF